MLRFHGPRTSDLHGKIRRKCGGQICTRQNTRRSWERIHRVAFGRTGKVFPILRSSGAQTKSDIAKMKEPILRSRYEEVSGYEIETICTFRLQRRHRLRRADKAKGEIRGFVVLRALRKHWSGGRRLLGRSLLLSNALKMTKRNDG